MKNLAQRDIEIILSFALHVAKVDHEFDVYERKILRHLVDVMGVTEEMKAHLLREENFLNARLEQLSSPEAKTLLVMTLCAVAFANGTIHRAEAEFIEKVNDRLGAPVELLPAGQWGGYEQEVVSRVQKAAGAELSEVG